MLDIAIQAAKEGGRIAYSYFKKMPKVVYKPDNTPVTKADIEAEKAIRKIISKNFPTHGIIGEEIENTNPNSQLQWVIDPIDGTKSYVRGIKDWGVLLALLKKNKPIIGIYFAPATDELFSCNTGSGTYLNGKRTYVSKVKDLKKSFIVHSSINHFDDFGKVNNLVRLAKTVQGKRGASDCAGINMLLKGQADVNISGRGSVWDYAATSILTEEAGGKYTDLNNRFNLYNTVGVFSNGLVHKQILNFLK